MNATGLRHSAPERKAFGSKGEDAAGHPRNGTGSRSGAHAERWERSSPPPGRKGVCPFWQLDRCGGLGEQWSVHFLRGLRQAEVGEMSPKLQQVG